MMHSFQCICAVVLCLSFSFYYAYFYFTFGKPFLQLKNHHECFEENESLVNNSSTTICLCKKNRWYGKRCHLFTISPGFDLQTSDLHSNLQRKIIYAFPFNIEFDALETIVHDSSDIVDKFIILESNYSAYGDPKPRRLHKRLQNDSSYLKEFREKIVYVFLDHFPEDGRKDGWIADRHIRASLGTLGVKSIINTLSPHDIILVTDIDEIISRETILKLKSQNLPSEPFGMDFYWSIYGYFWRLPKPTRTVNGCTIKMLKYAFDFDTHALRDWQMSRRKIQVEGYVTLFDIPNKVFYFPRAGWHCSWCFTPKNVAIKLISAQNGDFPRWGDYPEKRSITYIKNNIKNGLWFDGKSLGAVNLNMLDPDFAPQHVLKNFKKYEHIIRNKYENETL